MMLTIAPEKLAAWRYQSYNLASERWLRTPEQAVEFVDRRGFVFFWPIKNTVLPSVWKATVGDRGVPNNHDDPGHVTWGWKDGMLGKRRWYYGRCIRKRNAMISLDLLPAFYALSPNYGAPETDFLDQYIQGLLSPEAKSIYALLLELGPMDSLALRREAGLSASSATSRFKRGLDTLQMEFKILPVGISDSGRWQYAHVYGIVPQHFPDLLDEAAKISDGQARQKILSCYLESVGAIEVKQAARLLGWKLADGKKTAQLLVEQGVLVDDVKLEGKEGPLIAIAKLVS
jgi:DNA glycosylase AlkZ-like